MAETKLKQVSKATKENVMAELEAAIDDDAVAVVTFVINQPEEEDDDTNVKDLARMPPGAAESIEPIIHEAFEELVVRHRSFLRSQANAVVHSIHGKPFEDLPPSVQAYWEFNEDLASLLDVLVERNLVRKPIDVFYTPLKQFVRDGDFISSPELFEFVEAGPSINGDLIPALCWIAAAHLGDIDPLNPPDDFTEASAANLAKVIESFLYRVAETELITCV